jgi:hypothetical protein
LQTFWELALIKCICIWVLLFRVLFLYLKIEKLLVV